MQRPDPKEIERIRTQYEHHGYMLSWDEVGTLFAQIDWLQQELARALDPTNPEEPP